MKKLVTLAMVLTMVTGLTACGDSSEAGSTAASSSAQADVSSVSLTDATGKNFTVGVADGWKLMTASEIGSMMETADFLVKGDKYEATGPYLQISQTTGNINDWVEQTKKDTYVKYDGEYEIKGIKWYMADKVAGAEIDGKIVTVYPQNGVSMKDKDVQAMMGSIRWAK